MKQKPTKTISTRRFYRFRFLRPLALVWALAALTGCATTGSKVSQSTTLDLNGDGRISKAEYAQARLQRAFKRLDVNGDKKITLEEWKKVDKSPEAEKNFRALDENGDQYISLAEFLDLVPKHSNLDEVISRMDLDADNYLSDNEMKDEPAVNLFSFSF